MTGAAAVMVPGADAIDTAKRRQIIEGARQVFLTQGFDAASMGEIARQAGVSKGTLYVYFTSKEELFGAIVADQCLAHAEGVFVLDPNDHDVAAVLTRVGRSFVRNMSQPRGLSSMRTVVSIAARMPEMGRTFYETGPATGIAKVAAYVQANHDAGVLDVEDCEVAAAQFLDSCLSTTFKPLIFNFGDPPSEERIDRVVGIAVRTFMAAYRRR